MARLVQVWTDNLAEQRILEAILRDRLRREEVVVESGLGGTSILSICSSILIREPDQPVAMVLNAEGDEPDEFHRQIRGYMPGLDTWVGALAVPDVDAWAWADPRLAGIFRSTPHLINDRYNRAAEIGRLTREIPFDVEALRRKDAEFLRLDGFLDRYARAGRRQKIRRS